MNPAQYPANNTEELQAVVTFLGLLDLSRIKPDAKWLDKVPNTDGQIEIVDERQFSLGKIEIQIKKIPNGDASFQCPLELIAYSQRISLPFLLVCVDVGNKKAYFRHLHNSIVPELKAGQQSFSIKFDPKVHLISNETQYLNQWIGIIQEYNNRVSDYPRLKQIESELNLANISKEDRIYFQEFIEHVNRLLDFDFPIVKEQFFKGVWKLGVGVSSANENEVSFQIYTIQPGEPAILVSGMPYSRTVSFTFPGGKTFQYNFRARSALKSAQQEASRFVFSNLRQIFQRKKLALCSRRLAIEYLFWFVDHFGSSIGVREADRLNLNQLNFGISVYLPAWASLAVPRFLGELIRLNENNTEALVPVLAAPPFETIANSIPEDMLAMLPPELRPKHQPANEEVLNLIKLGSNLRPVPVYFHEVSLQSLTEAVDLLLGANEEWIERPYKPRTFNPETKWSGFALEALRHNVRVVLADSLDEYRIFVERNRIPLKNSLFLHQPKAIFYVANLAEWAEPKQFESYYLKTYVVNNEDAKLPKITFIDISEDKTNFSVDGRTLKWNGLQKEIMEWRDGAFDDQFEKLPMLNRYYSMLQSDLQDEFKPDWA